MIQYLTEGLKLLLKRIDLYLIALIFSIVALLLNQYSLQNQAWFISVLSFLVLYLGIVYSILVPKLLTEKAQDFGSLVSKIIPQLLHFAKRLIIPSLVFIFFFGILIVLYMGLGVSILTSAGMATGVEDSFRLLGESIEQPFSLFFLVMGLLFLPLTFFNVYYSVEGLGAMAALKKSTRATFKHLKFALLLILLTYIQVSLVSYLPVESFWSQSIKSVVGGFVSIWLYSAAVLVYYQKVLHSSK